MQAYINLEQQKSFITSHVELSTLSFHYHCKNILNFYFLTKRNFFFSDLKASYKLSKVVSNIKKALSKNVGQKCPRSSCLITTQLSKTMRHMSEMFINTQQHDLAKFAAFWSLRKILKVDRRVSDVAKCFRGAMNILSLTGEADKFVWLQEAALVQVAICLFNSVLDSDGLISITRMYISLVLCL